MFGPNLLNDVRASVRASSASARRSATPESLSSERSLRIGETASVSASERENAADSCQSFSVLARVSSENRNAVLSTYSSRRRAIAMILAGAVSSKDTLESVVSSERNSAAMAACFLRSQRVARSSVSGGAAKDVCVSSFCDRSSQGARPR